MSRKKTQQNNREIVRAIAALVIIAVALFGVLQLGVVGALINNVMRVVFGDPLYLYFYYSGIIFMALLMMLSPQSFQQSGKVWLSLGLIYLSLLLVMSLSIPKTSTGLTIISNAISNIPYIFQSTEVRAYSGLVGASVYGITSYLVDRIGVYIVIAGFLLTTFLLWTGPIRVKFNKPRLKRKKRAKQVEAPIIEDSVDEMFADDFYDDVDDEPKTSWTDRFNFLKFWKNIPELDDDDDFYDESVKPTFMTLDELAEHQDVRLIEDTANTHSLFMEADGYQPSANPALETKPTVRPVSTNSTKVSFAQYALPSVRLLDAASHRKQSQLNERVAQEKGQRLINVLKQFGIEADLVQTHIGPAVTKFELKPDGNVKISKISSIQDNLMMELAVKTLRIEAPIPGKSAVGIEIPNAEMVPVRMKEVIQMTPNFFAGDDIKVALGKNLMGQSVIAPLNKMPHLLIAGATGSGKSVCMNAIITSLLLTKKPDELKLLLIDPKKVEFAVFENIPHLIGPVISDPLQAATALKVVVDEMDQRYNIFSQAGVRNIASYNEKVRNYPEDNLEKMPWIVVVIDELADLMVVAGKDVEQSIQRITQLARAAGIHLIVATQRPSVDVVTGIIKANIPSRIAFAVSSSVDSRTILDTMGAEKLLGYGDMLYIPMGEPNPARVQGVFISDDEVKAIANRAKDQSAPRYYDAFINLESVEGNHGMVKGTDDPLYDEVRQFVIAQQKASTSLLQRRFQIGYNRAARMIDLLQENGIVGPAQGSKPRRVLIQEDIEEAM